MTQHSEHTPGPWRAVFDDQPQPLYSGLVCLLQHGDEYKAVVTESGAVSWAEQWEANAKLIAAAPDLLAALANAADFLVAFEGSVVTPDDPDSWSNPDLFECYQDMMAALKRAKA